MNKKNPLKSTDFRGFWSEWGDSTPGLLIPNLCLNLQEALLRPLWRFPALLRFLFETLLPCLFQT